LTSSWSLILQPSQWARSNIHKIINMFIVAFYSQVLATSYQARKFLDPSVGCWFGTSVFQTTNGPVYLRVLLFSLVNYHVTSAPVSFGASLTWGTKNSILRSSSYVATESQPSQKSSTGPIWEYVCGNSQKKEELQSWQVTTVLGNCWIRKLLWVTGCRVKRLANSPSFHCTHCRHKKRDKEKEKS